MSASTIARWNAIPLERSENPESSKRKSQDDDDDDDDDVSIVSRTPSPPPDGMDVDTEDISKYDEYVRRPAREVITVETKIKPTNKGFAMLAKLGWTEGTPLGLSGDGRVDPIPFQMKSDSTGLGKVNQDVRMIESTVSQRRELDSERQQKESDEQRQAREDAVARREAVASELSDVLKAFYCALCDKQFKNVAQYDEHTNSYAHHHKARFKDMQASVRMKPQEETDKRKEKERKREEKELRKIAAANGIKMSKTTTTVSVPSAAPSFATTDDTSTDFKSSVGWATVPGSGTGSAPSGVKKSGWATVGASSSQSTQVADAPKSSSGGWATESKLPSATPAFRTGGWSTLDTSPSGTTSIASAPKSSGGWATVSSAEDRDISARSSTAGTPASRTGGWSTLDKQSDPPNPLPSGSSSQQQSTTSKGGWKTVSAPAFSSLANPSSTSSAQDATDAPHVKPPAPANGGWNVVNTPAPNLTVTSQDTVTTATASHPPSKAHTSRVGWQQFQKSNTRRK